MSRNNENIRESDRKGAQPRNSHGQKTNYEDINALQSKISQMKQNRSRGNLEVNDMNAGINNMRSNNNYNSNSNNQTTNFGSQRQDDVFSKLNHMKQKMYNVLNNNQDN